MLIFVHKIVIVGVKCLKVVNNTKFSLAVKIFDVKLLLNSSVYINESSSKYTSRHIESENNAEIFCLGIMLIYAN